MRQDGGFHGRPGKPSDTCYSFWIGATLQMLGVSHLSDSEENRAFVLSTQVPITGGFAKFNYSRADPLHTYLGKFSPYFLFFTKMIKLGLFKIENSLISKK